MYVVFLCRNEFLDLLSSDQLTIDTGYFGSCAVGHQMQLSQRAAIVGGHLQLINGTIH